MKRILVSICVAAIALAIVATGAYSNFTVEDSAENVVTTGSIDFEIHEVMDDGKKFPVNGIEVMPGDVVGKTVTVENTSNHPLFLRVKLVKGVEGNSLPADNQLQVDINTTDWTLKDGYYYYNKELKAHEETEPLFTKVSVDGPSVTYEYIGLSFLLDVKGYAVQSENNSDSPLTALGWPEDKTVN